MSGWNYDVFLSFRGEDTRTSFTDHLYTALNRKGVFIFRDDKELKRGKSIRPELFKAIEESRFAIIVFSKNYACSTWCLDELVSIVECKFIDEQQLIFPIFYDVKPTVVRKQKKNFKKAFAKHENAFGESEEKVQKWREALQIVADMSGWELKNRNESEFIEDIAEEISSKLIPRTFETYKELVGINLRLEELMQVLDKGFDDVRMIGICGMGGLGKTTIASVIYNLISWQFEASSFVPDVREICERKGLVYLQKKLLSRLLNLKHNSIGNVFEGINVLENRLRCKKVFLVVDDVVNAKQLESLVGKHHWFGSGSRIIITSRDEHLLITHGVNEVYKLGGLDIDEARELFCLKAFKTHEPMKGYENLSECVVQYAAGLPLALTVLGSFLFGKTLKEWESALKRLKRDFEKEIFDVLQISFDGLKETEKNIFLDIACFFKGEDKEYVMDILEGFDFDPVIGTRVLIEKSLISVNNNILWMHELLQEMGHRIVKRESKEPGKRSRLWKEADIHHVLSKTKRLNMLKVIILSQCQKLIKAPDFTEALSLEELFLIDCSRLQEIPPSLLVHQKLKVLYIKDCTSLESLPGKIGMDSLRKLVLSGCAKLKNFPEIGSSMGCLSELFVDRTSITELPLPVEFLYGLVLLSLKDCKNFKYLPSHLSGLKRLQILNLSGCSKLRNFPEIVERMECLSELYLDGTAITKLPIELLPGLVFLNLKDCKNFESLGSDVITGLKHLKILNLSGCSKLRMFPKFLEKVECLTELNLEGTSIEELSTFDELCELAGLNLEKSKTILRFPRLHSLASLQRLYLVKSRAPISHSMGIKLQSLSRLCSLTKLDLSDCNLGEGVIPVDICKLSSLKTLNLSRNYFISLPGTINRLSKLKDLLLEDCKRLKSLPELPSNIEKVRVDGCASLETLSIVRVYKSFNLYAIKCLKLVGNNDSAISMVKMFLEAESKSDWFDIVVHGSKIPERCKHQNEDSSITIARPPDSYCNNKLVGYAICAIFHVHEHPPTVRSSPLFRTHQLHCHLKADDGESSTSFFVDFNEQLGKPVSDHLWVHYLSMEKLNAQCWNFGANNVEISFCPGSDSGPGLEVKRCGVHPVYVEEVKEFNKTTNEWITSKIWNVNEFDDQVFDESTMDVATTSKRSLTDYADTKASDDEQPQHKRLRE